MIVLSLEPFYLYILTQLPQAKLGDIQTLKAKTGSYANLFKLSGNQLAQLGFTKPQIESLNKSKSYSSLQKLIASSERNNISLLSIEDPLYFSLLKQIPDPPPVLFYRGNLIADDELCIGVVGTRMISNYGKSILPKLIKELVSTKLTIVSGLAYGIDALAHKETLNNSGRTIAVLGSGIDSPSLYPKPHSYLADQIIAAGGLIISEYPPGTPGFRHQYVARNRIIAGISQGSLIVECKSKSGALITADFAMDFNRSVYAIPGPIYSPTSEGPNNLIKQGAITITRAEDILTDLGIEVSSEPIAKPTLSGSEQRVLKCMQTGPCTIDALQAATSLPAQELISVLSGLELAELIRNAGAEGFIAL